MHDMIAYKGQQSKDHTFRGSIRRLSQAYRQGSPTVRHCLSRPRRTPPRHVAPVAQGHAAPPKAQTKSSSRDARNGFRLPSVPIRQMCCNAHASTIRGEVLTALGLGPSPTEFFSRLVSRRRFHCRGASSAVSRLTYHRCVRARAPGASGHPENSVL